jgi:hypothetical protein
MTAPGQVYGGQQQCSHGWGKCDRTDTHPYAAGPRCPDHTPAKLAGLPEPDSKRYCLAICYCGQCPHRRARPLAPITDNVVDFRAVASGKRRSSPAAYREAQTHTRGATA